MDTLGDRMKAFEAEYETYLSPISMPTYVRIDGRGFSRYTKGRFMKPFDNRLNGLFKYATIELMKEFDCIFGYFQSDEISLVIPTGKLKFNNRVQKNVSTIASFVTAVFNDAYLDIIGIKPNKLATFDTRILQMTETDIASMITWRAIDAKKNSVSSLAQVYFSANDLKNKSTEQRLEMLSDINVDWFLLPYQQKYGTFVKRQKVLMPFTNEEINELPLKHKAREDNNLIVQRYKYNILEELNYLSIQDNNERIDLIFGEVNNE